jgi:hypothetical protein
LESLRFHVFLNFFRLSPYLWDRIQGSNPLSGRRNMKLRKVAVVFILVLLGVACGGAVMALYTDYSVRASAPSLPDALNNIPSDYQFVFGCNVTMLVQSPAYSRFRQNNTIGNELFSFTEKTGLDPARDVSYVLGAGHSKPNSRNEGVVIVVGRFDKEAIAGYIRSKSNPEEIEYNGASILMIPDPKSNTVKSGIAFLDSQEIAAGDLEALKAVLDTRGNAGKGILSNTAIAPLIDEVSSESMIWFAGDATGVLTRTPAAAPLAGNFPDIKNVFGKLNVNDAVTGNVSATALNAESATKLADAVRGLIALGQLAGGNRNPGLKTLLGGLVVSQESARVSVALNIPVDVLNTFGQLRTAQHPPAIR